MSSKITIGPAVHRRRRALGWSLQRLSDETKGAVGNGYLSDIEKEVSNPTVEKAYALANALGTNVDQLISESMHGATPLAPVESARRAPVIPWEKAAEWAQNPDISRLPSGTPWEMPLDPQIVRGFFLRLADESMHAPAGVAFPAGSLIFVDPHQEPQPNDFVVGYTDDPREPTFKKLVQDGSQRYLRALNPQFPVRQIDGDFKPIGVVLGMVMRTVRGVVR